MPTRIKKCINCKKYTLANDKCPYCGSPLKNPHPINISFEKYKKYFYKKGT
jgi:H/ACA ribonucleoprotein complex subunit 3